MDHELSLLAGLLGDHTPLPGLVAIGGAACLFLAGLRAFVMGDPGMRQRLWRLLAGSLVISCAGVVALCLSLWVLDLHVLVPRVNAELRELTLRFVLTVVAVPALTGLMLLRLLFKPGRRLALATVILPLVAALTLPSILEAYLPPGLFPRWALPSLLTRYPLTFAGVGLVLVLLVVAWLVVRRLGLSTSWASPAMALIVAPWSLALFAILCLGVILPEHHLCLSSEHVELQQWAATVLTVLFAAVAVGLIASTVAALRRRLAKQ